MRVKIIKNGQVVNTIEADLAWARQAFPDATVEPDTSVANYDPPPGQAKRPPLSKLEFRRLFTPEELVRFDNPEMFISSLTDAQRAQIRTMQRNFELATYIDLDDPLVAQGLQAMVQYGLLTEARKNEILGVGL
ncbi:MAG: hypothetical protein ACP5QB_10125 [Thiomonas sp.]